MEKVPTASVLEDGQVIFESDQTAELQQLAAETPVNQNIEKPTGDFDLASPGGIFLVSVLVATAGGRYMPRAARYCRDKYSEIKGRISSETA